MFFFGNLEKKKFSIISLKKWFKGKKIIFLLKILCIDILFEYLELKLNANTTYWSLNFLFYLNIFIIISFIIINIEFFYVTFIENMEQKIIEFHMLS